MLPIGKMPGGRALAQAACGSLDAIKGKGVHVAAASLRPYGHGGDIWTSRERWGAGVVDFSANTNPFGMSAAARKAAEAALDDADRYPDPQCRELAAAIAEHEDIDPAALLCGNGAADLIWRLMAALRPATVLVCAPTFSEYAQAAQAVGAQMREHVLIEDDGFAVGTRLIDDIHDDVDLVFLCSPNNPTGRTVAPEVLAAVLRRCREAGALLALDECFLGFVDDGPTRSLVRVAAAGSGLIVFRAFTKLYGIAGLRLGYVVSGDAELTARMYAAGPPWAVSSIAQAAGVAALADRTFVDRTRTLISEERPRVAAALEAAGCAVVPGEANYLLVKCPVGDMPERMAARGVIVRSCDSFSGLSPAYIRVAIRTPKENDLLIDAARTSLAGEGKVEAPWQNR